ncbi:D-aminoacyl-tRNA deacylase [Emcibacter sp. SYSU 3D8]|uniref:D-aminoacyl-tRNA deacylase n=1 Tax=Emcibacter sp. SYSU 3D8 TaxID=3133969 RepID=UPI0031FE5C77
MLALLQRVTEAAVSVANPEGKWETVGAIGPGLLVLLCAEHGDTGDDARYFAGKIARMRLFPDDAGKTNLSVRDVNGAALVVSQFTLAADWRKGNRPGFSRAAAPDEARALYEAFCALLAAEGVPVETGRFAASMQVSLVNDGPFTIWMDSREA